MIDMIPIFHSLNTALSALDAEFAPKSVSGVTHDVALGRKTALLNVDSICRDIRSIQPRLDECTDSDFGTANELCNMIAFGRIRFAFEREWRGFVPRLLPFPIKAPLLFGTSEDDKRWIRNLLLRLFQCVPLSQISITVVDPVALGQSLPGFQVFLKHRLPFPAQKILTRENEIEQALDEHLSYVENLTQKVFGTGISDWNGYHQKHLSRGLPYRLLIFYDFPEQISEKSALYLARLLEHGPRCGVLPVLSLDEHSFSEGSYAPLFDLIERKSWKNGEICRHSSLVSQIRNMTFTDELEPTPSREKRSRLLAQMSQRFSVLDLSDAEEKTNPTIPEDSDFMMVDGGPGIPLLLGEKEDLNSTPFTVDIASKNLLITGGNVKRRAGVLLAILKSLHVQRPNSPVLYHTSRKEETLPSALVPESVILKDSRWNATDLGRFVASEGEKFIVIDSFDHATVFQSSFFSGVQSAKESNSPANILKIVANSAGFSRTHIILFVDDYASFENSARELFRTFDFQIVLESEDEADKMLFIDRKQNTQTPIRLFVIP